MNTSVKPSSEKPKPEEKPRSFFARLNLRLPWLKLVAVIVIGLMAILDLLDLTISKLDDLTDDFPTTPMSKHVKVTERTLNGKKLVALTFDDGPSPETTPRLLDILAQKNTIATFFMLGSMTRRHPELANRVRNNGHEIASHTMYHQNLVRLSREAIESDINESREVFKNILGSSPAFIRPPYGNFNDKVRSVSSTPLILWSVDSLDWKNRDPTTIVETIISQIHDGAIILMHDIYSSSVDSVATIIDALRAQDYEFATISELADKRGITLSPEAAYYKFSP